MSSFIRFCIYFVSIVFSLTSLVSCEADLDSDYIDCSFLEEVNWYPDSFSDDEFVAKSGSYTRFEDGVVIKGSVKTGEEIVVCDYHLTYDDYIVLDYNDFSMSYYIQELSRSKLVLRSVDDFGNYSYSYFVSE